jgi:hypothetical protein
MTTSRNAGDPATPGANPAPVRTGAAKADWVSRRAFLGQGAWGVAALGAGARSAAGAAAVDPKENPWRYDVESLRRVDPALVHYERFVQFPVGSPNPRRLAVGADGRIHVAAGRSVLVFDSEGKPSATIAVRDLVRCVRAGPEGRVWVGLRDRVEVYDAEGKRSARWPAVGGKAFLTGIALSADASEVFVADSGNRVVYRCDAAGRIELRIGERNGARNVPGLVLPSPFLDVEMGADGLLRINNPGRHQVEVYTRDGELEQRWGRAGVAIDAFCGCCNPINLAVLPDGRCLTAEKGLPRVKLFAADGRLESVVAPPDSFAPVTSEDRETGVEDTFGDGLDVAVDPEGRVWVLDLVGATVQGFRRKSVAGEGKEKATG